MKIFRNFFLTLLSVIIFVSSAGAEYIFMKDGSIASGKIESETTAAITFRTNDGKVLSIDPKKVLRIIYAELYMGKLYVQKVDGTVFEAYMVDEDRSTYTFRKNLYSPVEMVVRRDDVLFAARKNPRELEGRVEPDRIILKWKPPYSSIKEYNIYVRSSGAYTLAGKSGSPKFKVKGVKSNTMYAVKVTAIDNDGYESIPTNEINIRTLKVKPEPPEHVRCEHIADKSGKTYTARITWDRIHSVDGRIAGYRVLEKSGGVFREVGFVQQNRFEMKNIDESKRPVYTVRAVETREWESENSRTVTPLNGYDISLQPYYVRPFGKFSKVNVYGYGSLLNGIKRDVFIDGLDFGISAGFWNFKGATTSTGNVDVSFMLPLLVSAGYTFRPFSSFSISPRIAFGVSYNSVKYKVEPDLYTGYALVKQDKSVSSVEPLFLGGILFKYDITDRWFAGIGADYGCVIEKSSLMSFLGISLSAGFRF